MRLYFISANTDLQTDHPQLDSLLDAEKIVIEIETFTDGRVFGLERLLRDKVGFKGDLEVSSDFLPGQISFLERCGVNLFSGEEIIGDAFNYNSGGTVMSTSTPGYRRGNFHPPVEGRVQLQLLQLAPGMKTKLLGTGFSAGRGEAMYVWRPSIESCSASLKSESGGPDLKVKIFAFE